MADTTVCSSEASSKSSEHRASLRKSNKPLMEKKRRARINTCLGQLKSLVLQALKKDTSQFSKLEKADILEMTVKHLKSVQQQHMSAAMATDPNVLTKYRAGFNECASEVMRYLGSVNGLTDDTRARVLNHLAVCMQSVSTAASVSLATQAATANQTPVGGHTGTFGIPAPLFPAFSSQQPQPQCTQTVSTPSLNMLPGSNSLPNIQIPTPRIPQQLLQGKPDTACATSLQLIPGTLPSGQLAFFVASPTAIQTPIQAIPVYTTPSSGTPTPVSSPDISPATSERKPSISPTVNVISSSDSRDEPDSFDETNRSPERFPNNDGPVSLRFPPVSSSVICSPPQEPRSPGFITDSDSAKEADADADDEPDPQDEDKVWRPW